MDILKMKKSQVLRNKFTMKRVTKKYSLKKLGMNYFHIKN